MKRTSCLLPALVATVMACAPLSALAKDAATRAQADPLRAATPLPAEPAFPVRLEGTARDPGGFVSPPGLRLRWQSAIPGLQFCVSYATAHGAYITGLMGGRAHTEDREHCMVAGRDGRVADTVGLGAFRNPDALLIASVVLVDNRVSSMAIPLAQLAQKAR